MGVRRASSILGRSGNWGPSVGGAGIHWHPWRGPSIHLGNPYCGRRRTNPALPLALGLVGFITLLWFIF